MWELVAKITNKGKIVGYLVRDERGITNNISKEQAAKGVQRIKGGTIRNGYLAIKGKRMGEFKSLDINKVTKKRRREYRNFTNWEEVTGIQLGGVTRKVVVRGTDEKLYMLKFAKNRRGAEIRDYISEFIGSKIAELLGYDVQRVELGYYKGEECVAVELFRGKITTFAGLGYKTLSGILLENDTKNYDLDWLLGIYKNDRFSMGETEYRTWVWKVFFLDMFIGNFDRHENNWGFIRESKGKYLPSPLFDMGASFYPKLMGENTDRLMEKEIRHIIEFNTRSAIKYKGKKKNYFETMEIYTKNNVVRQLLNEFIGKIDKIDFRGIFRYVREYNKEYEEYIRFVEKVVRLRRELLRRYE